MKFDILTSQYLNIFNESVYKPRRSSVMADVGTKIPKISQKKSEEAEKHIISLYNTFKKNPMDHAVLSDLFNTVRDFPDTGVIANTLTKGEFLKEVLLVAKKAGKDFGLILKSELGGESKSIDEWKARYGEDDKPYYYALKSIIDYMNGNTQERSIKEVADSTVDVYYFAYVDDPKDPLKRKIKKPFRTYVSVSNGNVGPSALSQPPLNRQMYKLTGINVSEHPPIYYIDGEEMPAQWKPKQLRGQSLEFVKDALNSDEAEREFKRLYPSEIQGVSTGTYGKGGRTGTIPTGKRATTPTA
jgi:hypothetical protein